MTDILTSITPNKDQVAAATLQRYKKRWGEASPDIEPALAAFASGLVGEASLRDRLREEHEQTGRIAGIRSNPVLRELQRQEQDNRSQAVKLAEAFQAAGMGEHESRVSARRARDELRSLIDAEREGSGLPRAREPGEGLA